MELFTFTSKANPAKQRATLSTLIDNVNNGRPATELVGKVLAVKVFANAVISGEMGADNAQIVGNALAKDLKAIGANTRKQAKIRNNADKALALLLQFSRDRQAEKASPPATIEVVQPSAPSANATQAPAASLADLTAMVMSLTTQFNAFVERS